MRAKDKLYMTILIKNATIILCDDDSPGVGDVLIADGKIDKLGGCLDAAADKIIDAAGLTVMSGFVDMHCHLREPGQEHKETIESGSRAAAAGGFVTVACMPNTVPVLDTPKLIDGVIKKAKAAASCRVLPIGAVTHGQNGAELTDFAGLYKAGAAALSDDGRPVGDSALMKKALISANKLDIALISHCEDLSIVGHGVINEGATSAKLGVGGISRAAEDIMTARDVILASTYNVPVHIAHVSTIGSLNTIRAAKNRGVRITCETCPHYFCLDDSRVEAVGSYAKINPPLRTKDDVMAVVEAIIDGTIDVIATDHAPHAKDEKARSLDKAPFGSIGLETAFSATYTYLVKPGHITLQKLSRLMSSAPSKILKLSGGKLVVGGVADLVIVDTNASYTVNGDKMQSKSSNTVFEGMQLYGKVVTTITDGEIKYDNRYTK